MPSPSCATTISRGRDGLGGGACWEGENSSEEDISKGTAAVFLLLLKIVLE